MRNHTRFLLSAALMATLLSCSNSKEVSRYQQATCIDRGDFESTQTLVGSTLQLDDIVLRPTRLQVCDTLLLTMNAGEGKLIHVFNLKTKKKIGERVSKGQGPDEMLYPDFVRAEGTCLQLYDAALSTLFTYDLHDFVANNHPIPVNRVKLNAQMSDRAQILGGTIICSAYSSNYQLSAYQPGGSKKDSLGTPPVSDIAFSDKEKPEAYKFSFVTNQVDKIALCYNWTDLIDILDASGKLLARIDGPQHFISAFKEFSDGRVHMAKRVKGQTRDAYFSPVTVGDDFFVLFSGKSEDEEGYSQLANQVFVFGWDGTPKQIFTLDQGVFAITVDKENKKIYGISDTPEFHIVEFSYQ